MSSYLKALSGRSWTNSFPLAGGAVVLVLAILVSAGIAFYVGRASHGPERVNAATVSQAQAFVAPASEHDEPPPYLGGFFSESDSTTKRTFHFPFDLEKTPGRISGLGPRRRNDCYRQRGQASYQCVFRHQQRYVQTVQAVYPVVDRLRE